MVKLPSLGGGSRTALVLALALVTAFVVPAVLSKASPPPPSSDLSAVSLPGEWTSFQRDAQNTGHAPGPAPAFTGAIKWKVTLPASVLSSPIVTGDAVYAGTGDGRFLALDPATGNTLWERATPGLVSAQPGVVGGLVYAGLRDGSLLALDRKTGAVRWQAETGASILGALKVSRGVLYLGTSAGAIVALDALTGKELWRFMTKGRVAAAPALTESGLLVIASEDGYVYVFQAASGRLKLKHLVVYPGNSSAAVIGDIAYLGRDQGALVALDLTETSRSWDAMVEWTKLQFYLIGFTNEMPVRRGLLWRLVPGQGHVSTPALADGSGYVVAQYGQARSGVGALHAVDLSAQAERWAYPVVGFQTPTVIGGTVYVTSEAGKVTALATGTGKVIWEWNAPGGMKPHTSPIVAADTLYVGASSSDQPVAVGRRDAQGAFLPDQSITTQGSWYYHYGGNYCSAPTVPTGPFDSQDAALNAGSDHTPTCGVLFAVQ